MKRLLQVTGLLFCLLFCKASFAQESVSGRVTDDAGAGVEGASVTQQNTSNGTLTDSAGNFTITMRPGASRNLQISSIGFAITTVTPVNGTANASMQRTSSTNSEVVVVGYTSQRRTTITGAVSTVNMGDADKRRIPDVSQLLQGQVAGVQVTQSTGAPGDPISIRIRGEGTIGNNSPLYIIDGVPSRDITFLAPSDIQSISVLKDASAAAIYGSRASAGVVVITTKAGRAGRTQVDINYFNGIQKVVNLPTLMNSDQYLDRQAAAWTNSGYTGENPYATLKAGGNYVNTDWLNELFTTGHSQNLQVNASGGSDKVQFLLSGAAYKQNGIVVYNNDQYQRLNFRANINANLTDRLRIGTNLQLSYAIQDKLSSSGDAPGLIRHSLIRPPVIPVYKDPSDPTYNPEDPFTDLPFFANPWSNADNRYEFSLNPVAAAKYTNDKRSDYKTFGNIYAEYGFLRDKELKFRSNVGLELDMTHNKAFAKNFGDIDGNSAYPGTGRQNRPTSLNENRGTEYTVTWNNTLNYTKTFGKHSINALVGTEYITNHSEVLGASRQIFDFSDPSFQYIDYGGVANLYNGGNASEWALFSYFGSATYSYDNRYMVTANLRADASSRFPKNNQWGYFPSVSAGWVLSNEAFMKDVNWLSYMKIRGSYGQLGNQEIDNYIYLTTYVRNGDQFVKSRYGNDNVKWETTNQADVGIDIGFLKNRVSLSLDYFDKRTSDILLPISLPSFVGRVSPTSVNAGDVSNKGFEASLSLRNAGRAFSYSFNANVSTLKNNVIKLAPTYPYIQGDVYRTAPGHSLASYYGYVADGIYQNQKEIDENLSPAGAAGIKPGFIRFKDLNGDGVINDNDRTYLGNSIPELYYGFTLTLGYKGFDLSALFQGVGEVYRYNDARQITDYDSRPFNHSTDIINSWSGEGTSNTIPIATFEDNGSSKKSSIFVENASYFRFKNLEVGYSFPSFGKTGIKGLRLYVSSQNIFTVTRYKGLDPESTDLLDKGTYPQSQAFLFGVNVKL